MAAELERSLVRGGTLATGMIEFIIEEVGSGSVLEACASSRPASFALRLDEGHSLPDGLLRISGRIDHSVAAIQSPLTGCVVVEQCPLALRSIELTLARIEWCTVGDLGHSIARETTDIQCTQVADGDVGRGLELPIHLVLPRLFTCPSIDADTWGVGFELAATAVMELHGGVVTASARLPVRLVRG